MFRRGGARMILFYLVTVLCFVGAVALGIVAVSAAVLLGLLTIVLSPVALVVAIVDALRGKLWR